MTVRPRNRGSDPTTSKAATIRPHSIIVNRLRATTRERCQQRHRRADIAVEQERKRYDADAQHQDGEQEAHQVADKDKRPSGAGGQHIMGEVSIEIGVA